MAELLHARDGGVLTTVVYRKEQSRLDLVHATWKSKDRRDASSGLTVTYNSGPRLCRSLNKVR